MESTKLFTDNNESLNIHDGRRLYIYICEWKYYGYNDISQCVHER